MRSVKIVGMDNLRRGVSKIVEMAVKYRGPVLIRNYSVYHGFVVSLRTAEALERAIRHREGEENGWWANAYPITEISTGWINYDDVVRQKMVRLVYHDKVIGAWVSNEYVELLKEIRPGWAKNFVWPYPFRMEETT